MPRRPTMWAGILDHQPMRPYQPRKRCKKHGVLLLQGSWVCPACQTEARHLEYLQRREEQREQLNEGRGR
jgi:hypothetical protein